MANILVIGSSNTDMVIKSQKLPAPGETILGGEFLMNPGGKGANQAVAAARLQGKVIFVGKIGQDIFGEQAKTLLEKEGIDTRYLLTDPENPSGIALINVDKEGENSIVVASGSNANLLPHDLDPMLDVIGTADIILLQLEIPLDTVVRAAHFAFEAGKRVILNPAPAQHLPKNVFPELFLITPNETEAGLLTGIEVTDIGSAEKAGRHLLSMGVDNVIITLGSKGALLVTDKMTRLLESPVVNAVDTTAAGDVFNGALAVALAENSDLQNAIIFANKAASISVTRMGAQASAPFRHEIH